MSACFFTSIGRLNMSDEVSQTSGTFPVSGTYLNSTPCIVSFDVNDT